MELIKEITLEDATPEYTNQVVIDNGDGSFTTMPKALWDELQAKQTEGGLI